MIDAKRICYCGHIADKHRLKTVWSNALNAWHATDRCTAAGCKCKHFEKTTFVAASGGFDGPSPYLVEAPNTIQLELI